MKKLLISFLISTLFFFTMAYSQTNQNIDLIVGLGLNGLNAGDSIPLSYAFSFGLIKNNFAILSTLTYGSLDKSPIIRVAGFSTKILFRLEDKIYFGLGPEIHITLLGLMGLNVGVSAYSNLTDDILVSIGYSDYDKLNCGLIFYL